MTRRPKLHALAIALLGALFAGQARADVRDEVVRALSREQRRADFIVLFDTSASMERHFAEARSFAASLVTLARPGDTLTFIAFAGRGSELMPPVTLRPGTRKDVLARLAKLKAPSGLYTDLGAGLEATLDALLRPDYASLSLVFVISDFCAEPPPSSPFAGKREGRSLCRHVTASESLRKKSARLLGSGDQTVRTFALALEPASEAGLAATRDTLGSLVRVDVKNRDLKRALDGMRQRLEYERAALLVEQMLAHPPVSLEPPTDPLSLQGERALTLRVTSRLPFAASVHITGLRTLDDSVRFALDGPARALSLAASGGASLTVRGARSPHGALPTQALPGQPFTFVENLEVELALDLELAPHAALEKLLGQAPRGHGKVRQRLQVRFVPPDAGIAPFSIAAPVARAPLALSPGAEATLRLTLESHAPWAELEVRCTLGGRTTGAVRVARASQTPLAVRVRNEAQPRPWRLARDELEEKSIRGTCSVAAIAPSGAAVPWGTYPVATRVRIAWREGLPGLPVLSAVAVLLLALAVYARELRIRVAPAALSGRLVVYAGPGKFRRVTVPLRGLVHLLVQGGAGGPEGEVRLHGDRLVLPGSEAALLELYAEKSGRKRVMRMRLMRGAALFGGRSLDGSPVLVRKGRTRFSLGGYQCRIER